jgi:hypothetical protein
MKTTEGALTESLTVDKYQMVTKVLSLSTTKHVAKLKITAL